MVFCSLNLSLEIRPLQQFLNPDFTKLTLIIVQKLVIRIQGLSRASFTNSGSEVHNKRLTCNCWYRVCLNQSSGWLCGALKKSPSSRTLPSLNPCELISINFMSRRHLKYGSLHLGPRVWDYPLRWGPQPGSKRIDCTTFKIVEIFTKN